MNNYCERIHRLFNNMERHSFPFEKEKIPSSGIYILFEKGECAHSADRIVRIGTHTGDGNLYARLKEHFITENKDRSIFRKNIGRAMLNKNNDDFLQYWEIDLTKKDNKIKWAGKIDIDKKQKIEKNITNYIQNNFSFVVFRVDDKDTRLALESKIISTVSLCTDCRPSANWLGNYSPKNRIKESGLWLVNELWKTSLNEEEVVKIENLVFHK